MSIIQPQPIATAPSPHARPGLLVPLAVAGLLAAALPVPLPRGASLAPNEECLTLADTPPSVNPRPVALLERCSLVYPNDVELLADLAAAYETAGSSGQVRTAYERAIVIDPGYADLRLRFGRFLLRQGEPGGAVREAEAALKVQPNRLALLQLLHAAQDAVTAADQ